MNILCVCCIYACCRVVAIRCPQAASWPVTLHAPWACRSMSMGVCVYVAGCVLGCRYTRCAAATLTDCDPGASATLHSAGDLTSRVIACADTAPTLVPRPLSLVGLQYCTRLNTSRPGSYNISFSLQWSPSATSSMQTFLVYRTVSWQGMVHSWSDGMARSHISSVNCV